MAHAGVEGPRENEWAMRKVKKQKAEQEWDEFVRSIRLTPAQKAQARERLEAQSEEAARNRVWEQFLALEGKVKFDIDINKLREDDD